MPVEAGAVRSKPAQFDRHVRTVCQLRYSLFPPEHNFVAFSRIRADTERPADVIENDGDIRKCAREVRKFSKLRMIKPGVETQPVAPQGGESAAERGARKQTCWSVAA